MCVFFSQGSYKKLLNYIKSAQAAKPVRLCDVNQGAPAFYSWFCKFFAVKTFRTWWFPHEKLLLVEFFFCFVTSALSSVP